MRLVALLAAFVLTSGCTGSKWKPCEHLEITTRNAAGQQQWLRYENARYRVRDTDPLTIAWEHMKCVDIESQAGTVEELCARESLTGPVDHVACR
ncbi:MAG: hypothetical protein HKN10_16140 [Myxococcales bacterium]|nr:hypothetical protein [Myxococcales bacterium]